MYIYIFLESPQISSDFQRLLDPKMLRAIEICINDLLCIICVLYQNMSSSDCLRGGSSRNRVQHRIQVKAGYEEVIQEILAGGEQVTQGQEGSPWQIHFPVGYTVGNQNSNSWEIKDNGIECLSAISHPKCEEAGSLTFQLPSVIG